MKVPHFAATLEKHQQTLNRGKTQTLQVNVGYLCNMACKHCHLDAGPGRKEVMTRETMATVIRLAERFPFQVIDITGGAPELVPDIDVLIAGLARHTKQLIFRSNLTALAGLADDSLLSVLKENRVTLVASLPATNASQAEAQRGNGVFEASISMLKRLNAEGYGMDDSGLELNLVANPTGAFLPLSQCQAEKRFKNDLGGKWGIVFNHLYTFANVPLGRFQKWLKNSGNYEHYMARLAENFNPSTLEGLMCRTLVSISWEGYLSDCDFNLAAGLYLGGRPIHISELTSLPGAGTPVLTGDHCYACTAGSGFT